MEERRKRKEREEKRREKEGKGLPHKGEEGKHRKSKSSKEEIRKKNSRKERSGQKEKKGTSKSPWKRCVQATATAKSQPNTVDEHASPSQPSANHMSTAMSSHRKSKQKERNSRGRVTSQHQPVTANTSGLALPHRAPAANHSSALPPHSSKDTTRKLWAGEEPQRLPVRNSSQTSSSSKTQQQPTASQESSTEGPADCPPSASGPSACGREKTAPPRPEAPELQPALGSCSDDDLSKEPPGSPPILSLQGSPVSVLSDEEDDELMEEEKIILRRPVLQPSPTSSPVCPSSPRKDVTTLTDDILRAETGTDLRHSDLAKLYGITDSPKEMVEEDPEEDEAETKDGSGSSSGESSSSQAPRRPHLHQTGVGDMFKSLASILGNHRYTYRGGPFGRPPPSALVGVKYSSSLSLGSEIHCQEPSSASTTLTNQTTSGQTPQPQAQSEPTSDEERDSKKHSPDGKPERSGQSKTNHDKVDNLDSEKESSQLSDKKVPGGSVKKSSNDQSKVNHNCDNDQASQHGTSTPSDSKITRDREKRGDKKKEKRAEESNKQIKKEREGAKGKKKEEKEGESSLKRKGETRKMNEQSERKRPKVKSEGESKTLGASSSSSKPVGPPKQPKESKTSSMGSEGSKHQSKEEKCQKAREKSQTISSEKTEPHSRTAEKESKDQEKVEAKTSTTISNTVTSTPKAAPATSVSSPSTVSPSSTTVSVTTATTTSAASAETTHASSSSAATSASSGPPQVRFPGGLGRADFLKLQALSIGPPKELKIRLIKVESGERSTFIASELEKKKVPLSEISIKNTAEEIINACK